MTIEQVLTTLATVLASIATPIIIAIVGFRINKSLAQYRSQLALNVKLIEKRIESYDAISSDLNDIFQFMTRVGLWKEISPQNLIKTKRSLDKLVYQNKPYWSPEFFTAYNSFIDECFEIKNGTGIDAKIKADIEKYKALDDWAVKFNSMFTGTKADKAMLRKKYNTLMTTVSNDVNPQI